MSLFPPIHLEQFSKQFLHLFGSIALYCQSSQSLTHSLFNKEKFPVHNVHSALELFEQVVQFYSQFAKYSITNSLRVALVDPDFDTILKSKVLSCFNGIISVFITP